MLENQPSQIPMVLLQIQFEGLMLQVVNKLGKGLEASIKQMESKIYGDKQYVAENIEWTAGIYPICRKEVTLMCLGFPASLFMVNLLFVFWYGPRRRCNIHAKHHFELHI